MNVCRLPITSLAHTTDTIYCSTDHYDNVSQDKTKPLYVSIEDKVFLLQIYPTIEDNKICISAFNRKKYGINLGSKICLKYIQT